MVKTKASRQPRGKCKPVAYGVGVVCSSIFLYQGNLFREVQNIRAVQSDVHLDATVGLIGQLILRAYWKSSRYDHGACRPSRGQSWIDQAMAPSHSRQLLAWTLPTIAALLSYLWFKRKRIGARSDPGEANKRPKEECNDSKSLKQEFEENEAVTSTPQSTPNKSFSRSLSGVESTPIDIIIPPELRASKSTPVVISDEDLDLEIEKIKSMKNGHLFPCKTLTSPKDIVAAPPQPPKTPSPIKEMVNLTPKVKKSKKGKMVEKEITATEEKLKALKVGNDAKTMIEDQKIERKNGKPETEMHRQSSERDSANHSPCDVMMASPSLSSISDNHSEGSSDSGKGGSDLATPPPSRTPAIDSISMTDVPIFYEFVIPQTLVGRLIGKHGCFVAQIKERANAMIIVKKHPTNTKLKICTIEGTKAEIDKSLKMIRDRFPIKKFEDVTLEEVHFTPVMSTVSLIPDHLYLKLIEGINNDTILSCMVAPNHLFLQQPTHPSYPGLSVLTSYMNGCYNETESPLLPQPIPENTICAAYSVDSWYRAMVLSTDEESDLSYVKFLDYGGFAYVENAKLRQIRGDFMLLPFQAAECLLANIRPVTEDGLWPEEAYSLVADVTKGSLVYTQVADYTEDGIPLVLCYVVVGPKSVVFLNQHLVDHGFAEWFTGEEAIPSTELQQQEEEGAVGGVVQV